jgi:molybdate transport system substrate-binding protein
VTVFAAASLGDVLRQAGDSYSKRSGATIAYSFAASSVLARQIEASGGADVFISADLDWMDYLDRKGMVDRATRRNLLGNHLVLIAPAGSGTSVHIRRKFDLLTVLAGGRLALADPQSVPAGKYARQSLSALGVWNSVAGHLVPGENVRAALAYVARGEAPLGIVYATDARAEPNVRVVGTFPDSSHEPIVYPAAVIRDAGPRARAFLDFLGGSEAAEIFEKAGFEIPGRARR